MKSDAPGRSSGAAAVGARREDELRGVSVIGFPSRTSSTVHRPDEGSKRAALHSVEPQYSSSITRVYISSQSPILSLA